MCCIAELFRLIYAYASPQIDLQIICSILIFAGLFLTTIEFSFFFYSRRIKKYRNHALDFRIHLKMNKSKEILFIYNGAHSKSTL